jgi:hypothetical protein
MRRLTTPRNERGATAVMVALLLVPMLGFGALVIDVGALVQERRELQNGADAAALAVAKDCAGGSCGAFDATADGFADANALDGDSNIDPGEVCGTGPGLPGCASPPTVPAGTNYVMVTTNTQEVSSGTNQITFKLGQLLGLTGASVDMSAVAAWGAVGSATTLPLTLSQNEFDCLLPGGVASLPSAEKTIYFHLSDEGVRPDCTVGPVSGLDNPGGFGWLDVPTPYSGECSAHVDADGYVGGNGGAGSPTPATTTGCTDAFFAGLIGTTVLMPIYSSIRNTGSNTEYFVAGSAGFTVTGYRFGGASPVSSPAPCGNPKRCISGFFEAYYALGAQPGGGAGNFGATTVSVVG